VAKKPEDNSIDYKSKPDYGRVPDYLSEVKAEVAAEVQASSYRVIFVFR